MLIELRMFYVECEYCDRGLEFSVHIQTPAKEYLEERGWEPTLYGYNEWICPECVKERNAY
jgi:hypothetical protein